MPALSFQREFVDALLRDDKQQTTRPQTDRFKAGDICHNYNEQRRRITDKPEYHLTPTGAVVMQDRYGMTKRQMLLNVFHAHFLGKVEITKVYDIRPCEMSDHDVNSWAIADGFLNYRLANIWFIARYGDDWMQRTWTVIRRNGWQERYFEAGEV